MISSFETANMMDELLVEFCMFLQKGWGEVRRLCLQWDSHSFRWCVCRVWFRLWWRCRPSALWEADPPRLHRPCSGPASSYPASDGWSVSPYAWYRDTRKMLALSLETTGTCVWCAVCVLYFVCRSSSCLCRRPLVSRSSASSLWVWRYWASFLLVSSSASLSCRFRERILWVIWRTDRHMSAKAHTNESTLKHEPTGDMMTVCVGFTVTATCCISTAWLVRTVMGTHSSLQTQTKDILERKWASRQKRSPKKDI